MMFLLHLLGLLYGVLGLAWFHLVATPGQLVTAAFAKQAQTLYPASFFSPIVASEDATGAETISFTKANWGLGLLAAYCGRYLLTRHRG